MNTSNDISQINRAPGALFTGFIVLEFLLLTGFSLFLWADPIYSHRVLAVQAGALTGIALALVWAGISVWRRGKHAPALSPALAYLIPAIMVLYFLVNMTID